MAKERRSYSKGRGPRENKEFNQKILDIARVTRVVAGGKRMRFRASVVIGDGKGRVGFAVRKGADVSTAINKAATAARKTLITVPIVNETIPHEVRSKFGAAMVLIKPAVKGSGVIAGSATRIVMELAGVNNVVAKSLGSSNKLNIAHATLTALQQLRKVSVLTAAPSLDKLPSGPSLPSGSELGVEDRAEGGTALSNSNGPKKEQVT